MVLTYLHFRILKFSLKIWGFPNFGVVYGKSIYKWMITRDTPMT